MKPALPVRPFPRAALPPGVRAATVAAAATLAVAAVAAITPASLAAQTGASDCPAGLEVLVERAWAARSGLDVGDTIRLGGAPSAVACPGRVAGTFEPPPDPATLTRERPRLLFHLPDLARLSDRPDEVDRFTIRLAPGADATRVAARLGSLMPGARVLPAAELADRSSATFRVIERFHRAIGWITLTASGVFLACLMVLRVQQRRRPVAGLRLTGISRRTVFLWLLVETTVISVLGGAAGIGIGHLASGAINAFYQRRYATALKFSIVGPDATVPALALAVVLGIGAGAVAAFLLLRADPLAEAGR